MHLSPRDKNIIIKINNGEITDLASFAFQFLSHEKGLHLNGAFSGYGVYVASNSSINLIENDEKFAAELIRFITLCKKLEKNDLIFIPEMAPVKHLHPWFHKNPSDPKPEFAPKTSTIFEQYKQFEIIKTLDLDTFIENNFLTSNEIIIHDEISARLFAQRWTIGISLASVLISTITSLLVAYFNYKTYSKERLVTITNLAPTPMPLEVKVINNSSSSNSQSKIKSTTTLNTQIKQ